MTNKLKEAKFFAELNLRGCRKSNKFLCTLPTDSLEIITSEFLSLVDRTRWISVAKEGLPKIGKNKNYVEVEVVYQFAGGRRGSDYAFFDDEDGWECPNIPMFGRGLPQHDDLEITHWRLRTPLPDPPEEAGE